MTKRSAFVPAFFLLFQMMLTVRRACEADCALIRRLADEVFPATYRGIITPSQMEYMMEWMYGAEVLAREMCGEFAWFIASADGEPCGYLSVQHEAEDLFHLQKIYVLPRFQGIGAGEFLFRHAVEYGDRMLMMNRGHIVLDRSGAEKAATSVDDILQQFNALSLDSGT